MDPIGFAMENFDAVGRWRDRDVRQAHRRLRRSSRWHASSTAMAGLKQMLLRNPEQFVGAVTQKLLMYGIGRNVQYYDQPAVRAIVREAAKRQLHNFPHS